MNNRYPPLSMNEGFETKTFLLKLKCMWGMVFRPLFIAGIGLSAYFWINRPSVCEHPFFQSTLQQLADKFCAVVIPVGCLIWFFHFPQPDDETGDKDQPYNVWANGSFFLFGVVILIWLLFRL